jgi:uncharacterized membrane protein
MKRIIVSLVVVGSMTAVGGASVSRPQENDDPTFTTIDPPGAIYSEAIDIDPAGDIVGRYYDGGFCTPGCGADDGHNHGFLLSRDNFTTIDFPGAVFTVAAAINPRGDIVGRYDLAANRTHGYILSGGEFQTIDYPEATATTAWGINPRGDIVGQYTAVDGQIHGYLLSEGQFTTIDFPGSIRTNAVKINPAGDIVGRYLSPDARSHAFLLSAGEFTSIEFPGAVETASLLPIGINPRGAIVSHYCEVEPCTGTGGFSSNENIHGFLLDGGEFTSFDVPDSFLTVAFGINARGDIVGLYKDRPTTTCSISPSCTQIHAFLRTRREREKHEQ